MERVLNFIQPVNLGSTLPSAAAGAPTGLRNLASSVLKKAGCGYGHDLVKNLVGRRPLRLMIIIIMGLTN